MISGLLNWVLDLSAPLQIVLFIVFIVGGFAALIKGADIFVGGASSIAKKLKVSSIVIGLTIVSIGTSLPEAAVSISGAIAGSADISIGNIVGSNMFNMLVVLGCSLVFVPIVVDRGVARQDLPFLIICAVLLLVFALVGGEGYILSRLECIILFALFIAYMVFTVVRAKKQKKQEEQNEISEGEQKNEQQNGQEEQVQPVWKSILFLFLGLACIIIGGDLVVFGAKNMAITFGMSEILVGLTIVAIGTSLPELVTSIIAAKKGENGIALGNIVGSSIFNILLIIGATGMLTPLVVDNKLIIDIILMLAACLITLIFILLRNLIKGKSDLPRYYGWILLVLYVGYLAYIILRDFVFVM